MPGIFFRVLRGCNWFITECASIYKNRSLGNSPCNKFTASGLISIHSGMIIELQVSAPSFICLILLGVFLTVTNLHDLLFILFILSKKLCRVHIRAHVPSLRLVHGYVVVKIWLLFVKSDFVIHPSSGCCFNRIEIKSLRKWEVTNSFVEEVRRLCSSLTRPAISHLFSFKIRRSANYVKFGNAARRILRLEKCERVGREVFLPACRPSRPYKITKLRLIRRELFVTQRRVMYGEKLFKESNISGLNYTYWPNCFCFEKNRKRLSISK